MCESFLRQRIIDKGWSAGRRLERAVAGQLDVDLSWSQRESPLVEEAHLLAR
jgi:hypothetical protein